MNLETFRHNTDFDWTLFDSSRFIVDLWRLIADCSGESVENTEATGQKSHAHPELGGYDFELHTASLGLDPRPMWEKLNDLSHSKNYLYPDSAEFIQSQLVDGFKPRILTFGEARYQMTKIAPTLDRLRGNHAATIACTAVLEPKGQYLTRMHEGERGVLTDDVPNQQLPRGFTEITIDRNRELSSPDQVDEGIFVVSSLAQAREVIRQL